MKIFFFNFEIFKLLFCTLCFTAYQGLYSQCYNKISVAEWSSASIRTDGTLWIWGYNNFGQIGDGTTIDKDTPTQIGTATNWDDIDVSKLFTLGVRNGRLFSWGKNDFGQLGDGTFINKFSPTQIGVANNWKSVSAGEYHSLALKDNGTLWGFGQNDTGELGIGTFMGTNIPLQIGSDSNWLKVVTGLRKTVALKTNGTLWAWGSSTPLGGSSQANKNTPTQVGIDTNWKDISLASEHVLCLKTNGTIWSWGQNSFGQLGIGNTSGLNFNPQQVGTDSNWEFISAGRDFSTAIKTNGTLWSWGLNDDGQYGNSATISSFVPLQIGTATNWREVQSGSFHSLAKKQANDRLWVWGQNYFGILGNGSSNSSLIPITVGTCTVLSSSNDFDDFNKNFILFPNPVSNIINIIPSNDQTIKSIIISDLSGKILMRTNNIQIINIENIVNGIYLIQIETKYSVHTKKIIKN
jgi:alpha-tubulin suppressor-like RCC1 family protein